jgi:HEAT repeat protein
VARCAAKDSVRPNLEALWDDLAATDATRAFRAVRLLQAFPEEAVALIQSRVKPAVAVAAANIDRWIDDLSSPQFGVRQSATEQLSKAGPQAGPALRRALSANPSLEVRQRLEALLGKEGTLSGDQLRAWRATEVLEGIGTPAAQQLLQKLAQGAPGDPISEEAKSCLKRLTR